MHGSRSKIRSNKSRQTALCPEGFNSGVKGLKLMGLGDQEVVFSV
jgi:hypothetical protein